MRYWFERIFCIKYWYTNGFRGKGGLADAQLVFTLCSFLGIFKKMSSKPPLPRQLVKRPSSNQKRAFLLIRFKLVFQKTDRKRKSGQNEILLFQNCV